MSFLQKKIEIRAEQVLYGSEEVGGERMVEGGRKEK
jgi:hypothetical protein